MTNIEGEADGAGAGAGVGAESLVEYDEQGDDSSSVEATNAADASWLDAASQELDEVEVDEYDIVSSPNDWNYSTIVNFIESGAMKIPAFQRNYVWDKKRASKLIESLLIGLPVPQVFLYEESRNNFIVIDGQQRLLTLYFYAKGRFPKPKIRGELRPTLSSGLLDESFLEDDEFFEPFKLALAKTTSGRVNRYQGLTYKGLKEDRTNLDLRTIRNIVVKQTSPSGNAAVFEIFSRLNTGGVNLSQQEIRASLYHSALFDQVLDLNLNPAWRSIVGQTSPDARMRDTEFLLRGLALARGLDGFTGSMSGFINTFCLQAQKYTDAQATQAIQSLLQFMELFEVQPGGVFMRGLGNKFSGVLFESFFAAWVRAGSPALSADAIVREIAVVKSSDAFADTLQEGSTKPTNIRRRVAIAEEAIGRLS
ncbi:GmrSD restriction endonuclease domain-containing protein [Cryobacterium cryoconiti]|uniref:DUF262 domain-containing protein n=1 Tax=Cryobacterium cryoconiti TaxID=1259239 RepID=A0A4Y8JZ55_9MICO|nr:DUF262 domain-containing protein [Cryobacterium cryoconiti]TFD30285.1 DUF262 domain-containing protein [Cryobacterium cryoconiti]